MKQMTEKPLTKMPEIPVTKTIEKVNPLEKYYRQPVIYITLPSKGKYYTKEVFEPTTTGEIPVLPMTAKDEIEFKTPDAMISGQATVNVIQSCLPNIKDAWELVNYDLDTVLLAIRIATYGETMDVSGTIPGITPAEVMNHTLNLPQLLETMKGIELKDEATTKSGFTIKCRPLTYKKLSDSQVSAFEQQKQYATVATSKMSDNEKGKSFAQNFAKLTELNFSMLIDAIIEITTPDKQIVSDSDQIKSFVNNANANINSEIQTVLGEIRTQAAIKPLKLKSTDEQIKKGAKATFEMPVTFDSSNFFA
jgi:hypothetical protein